MYTKTNWVNNTTPINDTNLNKIEQGIYDNSLRIETQVVTTANTNLNDYTENGEYYFDVDRAPINRPTGSNGWLKVINQTKNGAIKQLWFRQGTANANDYETYVRTLTGTWSDWKQYTVDRGTGRLAKATQRTSNKWMKICNVKYRIHSAGEFFYVKIFIGDGYNGNSNQNAYIDLICQLSANTASVSTEGRFGCKGILHPLLTGFTSNNTQIKIIANSNVDYDIWFYTSKTEYCYPNYIAYGSDLVTVTPKFELSDNAPTGTECNLDYSEIADANKPTNISSLLTSNAGTKGIDTSFKVGKVVTINCIVNSVNFPNATDWVDVLEIDSSILPTNQVYPHIFLPYYNSKLANTYITTNGIVKVRATEAIASTGVQIAVTYRTS